jgi:hypothetical protein
VRRDGSLGHSLKWLAMVLMEHEVDVLPGVINLTPNLTEAQQPAITPVLQRSRARVEQLTGLSVIQPLDGRLLGVFLQELLQVGESVLLKLVVSLALQ